MIKAGPRSVAVSSEGCHEEEGKLSHMVAQVHSDSLHCHFFGNSWGIFSANTIINLLFSTEPNTATWSCLLRGQFYWDWIGAIWMVLHCVMSPPSGHPIPCRAGECRHKEWMSGLYTLMGAILHLPHENRSTLITEELTSGYFSLTVVLSCNILNAFFRLISFLAWWRHRIIINVICGNSRGRQSNSNTQTVCNDYI